MATVEMTEETFDAKVLGEGKPALVDVWAPWCGPCRALAPVVEELAEEYEGKVTVAKVNADENPALTARYRIDAIPRLLFFKDGKLADSLIGVQPKAQIKQKLDQLLGA